MIAALAELHPVRLAVLFDSYEGLPPAQEIDGSAADLLKLRVLMLVFALPGVKAAL